MMKQQPYQVLICTVVSSCAGILIILLEIYLPNYLQLHRYAGSSTCQKKFEKKGLEVIEAAQAFKLKLLCRISPFRFLLLQAQQALQ